MSLDSYRIVTTRGKEPGEYLTEVTRDGKEVDSDSFVNMIIEEYKFKNMSVMASNSAINRLEVIVSGEDLK